MILRTINFKLGRKACQFNATRHDQGIRLAYRIGSNGLTLGFFDGYNADTIRQNLCCMSDAEIIKAVEWDYKQNY